MPYFNNYCKWLDHIVGRYCRCVSVSNVKVLYDMTAFDQLPFEAVVNFKDCIVYESGGPGGSLSSTESLQMVPWVTLRDEELQHIERDVIDYVGDMQECDAYQCCQLGCRHPTHIKQVHLMYEKIVTSVMISSEKYMRQKIKVNKFKIVPG